MAAGTAGLLFWAGCVETATFAACRAPAGFAAEVTGALGAGAGAFGGCVAAAATTAAVAAWGDAAGAALGEAAVAALAARGFGVAGALCARPLRVAHRASAVKLRSWIVVRITASLRAA
jgi:hypothetical protein